MMKTCTKCHEEKELAEFYKRKDSPDGYRNTCKSCKAKQAKLYNNSERGKEIRRVYQKSEAGKAAMARHRATDKGRKSRRKSDERYRNSERGRAKILARRESGAQKAYSDKWRASDKGKSWFSKYPTSERGKEVRREADRAYKQTEKGRMKAALKQQRRRAKIRNARIEPVNEQNVFKLCGNRCVYCGAVDKLTLDHVVSLARGGAHSESNLVVACALCNSSKGKKPLEEWIGTRVRTLAEGSDMLDCELV